MAMNFPSSPVQGQTTTQDGVNYIFDSGLWRVVPPSKTDWEILDKFSTSSPVAFREFFFPTTHKKFRLEGQVVGSANALVSFYAKKNGTLITTNGYFLNSIRKGGTAAPYAQNAALLSIGYITGYNGSSMAPEFETEIFPGSVAFVPTFRSESAYYDGAVAGAVDPSTWHIYVQQLGRLTSFLLQMNTGNMVAGTDVRLWGLPN